MSPFITKRYWNSKIHSFENKNSWKNFFSKWNRRRKKNWVALKADRSKIKRLSKIALFSGVMFISKNLMWNKIDTWNFFFDSKAAASFSVRKKRATSMKNQLGLLYMLNLGIDLETRDSLSTMKVFKTMLQFNARCRQNLQREYLATYTGLGIISFVPAFFDT